MLPGVFGFLAWELKENWRLYRSNQPRTLAPGPIGRHGETLRRLLNPGFHSGTIPKLFRKLRRGERHVLRMLDELADRKPRKALAEVEEAISHFVDRELLALLQNSHYNCLAQLTTGHIHLGCTSLRIELRGPSREEQIALIAFELRDGSLIARIDRAEWLEQLAESDMTAMGLALAGWYKRAGITWVVRTDDKLCASLLTSRVLTSAAISGFQEPHDITPYTRAKETMIYFDETEITWQHWIAAWGK